MILDAMKITYWIAMPLCTPQRVIKSIPRITIGYPKVWSLNPYKLGIVYKTSNYKSIEAFCAPNFERWLEAFTSLSGLKLGVKKHMNTRIIWNSYKTMCSTSTGSNLMLRIKNPILKITNPMLRVWNHGLPIIIIIIIIIIKKWESNSIGNCWTEPTTATDYTYMHDLKYILTSMFPHLHDQNGQRYEICIFKISTI
jgi:hypothetical protein